MQYSQIVVVLATLGGCVQAANDIKLNPLVKNIVLDDRAVATAYRSTATVVVARTGAVTSGNGLANGSGNSYYSYSAPSIAATSPEATTRGIDSAVATGSTVGTGSGVGAVPTSIAVPSATATDTGLETAIGSLTGSPMESPMETAMETGASNNSTETLDTSVAQGGVAKAAIGSGSIALALIGLLI